MKSPGKKVPITKPPVPDVVAPATDRRTLNLLHHNRSPDTLLEEMGHCNIWVSIHPHARDVGALNFMLHALDGEALHNFVKKGDEWDWQDCVYDLWNSFVGQCIASKDWTVNMPEPEHPVMPAFTQWQAASVPSSAPAVNQQSHMPPGWSESLALDFQFIAAPNGVQITFDRWGGNITATGATTQVLNPGDIWAIPMGGNRIEFQYDGHKLVWMPPPARKSSGNPIVDAQLLNFNAKARYGSDGCGCPKCGQMFPNPDQRTTHWCGITKAGDTFTISSDAISFNVN